jgi:hypothetical protein
MTTPPTSVESWEKEFDEQFCSKDTDFKDCLSDVGSIISSIEIKSFIHTLITRAKEEERDAVVQTALIEAYRRIKEWQNSEDYDHTTNDGLYSFVQYLHSLTPTTTPKETEV